MTKKKVYRIIESVYPLHGGVRLYTQEGTLEELIKYYKYTLECGKSYEHEKGNKKINLNPKNIRALCSNLENAKNNSAANGYSGATFSYEAI